MVGKVLTGNGITAYGNGAYSLIGGDDLSDTERDALQQLCRQRLDAFRAAWRRGVCPPQPPSALSLSNFVQLFSQGWNALGNDLPDGVLFQAEVGMRQNVAEASNASPGQVGVPLTDRRRDLFRRFPQYLQVAEYGVNHHLVSKKVLPGEPLAVSEHFGAAQLHVLEEQRPITGTPPFRQAERPPARSAAAVQGEDRGASPGPPGR